MTIALKMITTAFFCIATAGSTVDGRVIDAKLLKEMAEDYDPATYTARVNIEHIRGISAEPPFNAHGEILAVKMGKKTVRVGGKDEERDALYGQFAVLENAKKLNDAGQKVFPSIEIHPSFGDGGRAYLMGCALTDSPASIGTDKLKFNRKLPGTITVYASDSALEDALLEFETETEAPAAAVTGFFTKLTGILDGLKAPAPKVDPEPKPEPEGANAAQFAAVATAMTEGFTAMGKAMESLAASQAKSTAALETRLAKIETEFEATEAPGHTPRPKANGTANFVSTNC